jgi:hypothetical protein
MLRVGHRETPPSADTIKEKPAYALLYCTRLSPSLSFWHSVVFVHINIISALAVWF